MQNKPVICFYHKQCVDGTAAAAVVLTVYPNALCVPLAFDTALQEIDTTLGSITDETLVIFADTTVGLEIIAPLGNEVLVLDHHISERSRVDTLASVYQNVTFVFANTESGATLAWQYFFKAEPLPTLLAYVRDIDLYTNEFLPESEWLATYLSQYRDDPLAVRAFLTEDLDPIIKTGQLLVAYIDTEIEKMCTLTPLILDTAVGKIPAYNITNYQSKAGNLLATKMGTAVILFKISGDMVRCSIRSVTGQLPSALSVAREFGGGGHECSAGAGVKLVDFLARIER